MNIERITSSKLSAQKLAGLVEKSVISLIQQKAAPVVENKTVMQAVTSQKMAGEKADLLRTCLNKTEAQIKLDPTNVNLRTYYSLLNK